MLRLVALSGKEAEQFRKYPAHPTTAAGKGKVIIKVVDGRMTVAITINIAQDDSSKINTRLRVKVLRQLKIRPMLCTPAE